MTKQVLVVDDEAPTRELLKLYLEKRGFSVIAVATAEAALEVVKSNQINITLLDIDLGVSNGLDLIKPIKQIKPDLPIIIFTALGRNDEYVNRAYSDGAVGYITKTQPLDEMLAEINRHII